MFQDFVNIAYNPVTDSTFQDVSVLPPFLYVSAIDRQRAATMLRVICGISRAVVAPLLLSKDDQYIRQLRIVRMSVHQERQPLEANYLLFFSAVFY